MKTQILLFINYNSGLKHNAIYENLQNIYESIEQLRLEENLSEEIPTVEFLKTYLENEDDYLHTFSNNTWFHIQYFPIFNQK